jgi:hypothetical protein
MTYTGFGIDEKDLWLSQSDRVEPAVRERSGARCGVHVITLEHDLRIDYCFAT